jgi:hypothetical protein
MTIHRIEFKWFLKWLSKKNEIILCLVFGVWYLEGCRQLPLSHSPRCLAMPYGKGTPVFARPSLLTYFIDISTVY